MTIRELLWMGESRAQLEWRQTSSILAMIHNVNVGKGGSAKSPADFDPFARDTVIPGDITDLKVFLR